ncbi:AraC family transcriptional regulator [Yokenella regensburgei]|uniref:AraC family transcriptional regulator n=1 Tax=Yokenella regensburgei TaxID=158877 RepID=UPI001375D036|nr:helix-turn-helix domain-containing protein [Yokenella regensburgei]KAF1371258.1 AraC family transcriptional activator of adiA/AraC family transcriptional regulator [Yokenella regensburgei]
MRLCSSAPCVVVLTEKDVDVKINDTTSLILPANHLNVISCNNNIIDFSYLDNALVAHMSRSILNDYLQFLNRDLTQITPWPRQAIPVISRHCRTPDVFREAALHSVLETNEACDIERTRSLLFTVLSIFLESPGFIALIMQMLRNSVKDSVYQIIQSDIHKEWNLSLVASALCLSPSLLKKKLKYEDTSYSQIITDCRMRYAAQQLLIADKNISQISQLCGYRSTSYFISVFKTFYGTTPLHYVTQHRQECLTA